MFEFRTLGSVDLRAPDGRSLQSVLSQPKRTCLLAHLCVASAHGFQRRDVLIALFWPDSDRERGRNSVRQALHFLRRSLSAGVVATRGDEEVAVSRAELWCDVVEFEQALDAGRLAEAVELYRGEFLAGVHLADAPEFERWLTAERARLHARAADALRSLAEGCEAAGDLRAAEGWWRRLADGDPLDSRAALGLMRALAAAGDPVGALRHAELHARRVRDELGIEEDRAVRELADALRAPAPASPPAPPAPALAAVPDADSTSTSSPPPADAPRPGRVGAAIGWLRRSRQVALAGATALVLALVVGLLSGHHPGRGEASPPAAESSRVAVFPFTVRGAPDLAYLGEGMVDLLGAQLNTSGELLTVDPRTVMVAVSGLNGTTVDPERGGLLARGIGADQFVLGSIVEVGGTLRVSASLYNHRGGLQATTDVTGADRNELLPLIDRMAAELLAQRGPRPAERMARLAAVTTPSLPALKAYLRGERLFREQRYGASLHALQDALQHDSAFALAAYRLSVVADWVGEDEVARDAVARAARFAARLPQVERMMVDALLAFNASAPSESRRLYEAVLLREPRNVEALYRLAETEFHHNPLLGLTPSQSEASFRQVIAIDPGHLQARAHLARIATLHGDRRGFDSLVVPLAAGSPADSLRWMHLRAVAFGDDRALARLRPVRDSIGDALLWSLAEDAAVYTGNLRAAARIADELAAPRRSAELQMAGHLLQAWLDLTRGRPAAAERRLDLVAQRDPGAALETRALFATADFVPVPPARVRALRDSLAGWEEVGEENPYLALYSDMWPSIRQYLTGVLSARLGDAEDVERRVAALAPAPDASEESVAILTARADAVRARLAATQGDPARALRLLEGAADAGSIAPKSRRVNFFQRQLRPALLQATGRSGEALRWYSASPWRGSAYVEEVLWDQVHRAPAHLERARILERLGRTREAQAEYTRFADLWADAEPPLQAQVRAARRRAAELRRAD